MFKTTLARLAMVLQLVLLVGCSTYSTFEGDLPREDYVVLKMHTGGGMTGAAGIIEVDGKVLADGYSRLRTEAGYHRLVILQPWSNKYRERIEIAARFSGGHRYSFLFSEPTFNWGGDAGLLGGFLVGFPNLFKASAAKPASHRPFDAFVWIYDEDSRDVIWGLPPSNWR